MFRERGRENMVKIHICQCVYTHTYISHIHIAEPFAMHYPLKQSKHMKYTCVNISPNHTKEVDIMNLCILIFQYVYSKN